MDRQDKINSLVELILGKDYGEQISHEELMGAIGERSRTYLYRSCMSSAMKKVLERGKMIDNVRGYGYRVVNPDEYTEQSIKKISSGAKRIDRGTKIMMSAPVSLMSPEAREEHTRIMDKARILQAHVRGAQVEISMLENKRKHPLAVGDAGNVRSLDSGRWGA